MVKSDSLKARIQGWSLAALLWFIKDKLFHKSKCILVPTPFSAFGCTYTFSINPTHCFINKAPGSGNENTPSHLSTGERRHIVIAVRRRVPTREQSACRYAAVLPKKEPKPVSDCCACAITQQPHAGYPLSLFCCLKFQGQPRFVSTVHQELESRLLLSNQGGYIAYYRKWQLCLGENKTFRYWWLATSPVL